MEPIREEFSDTGILFVYVVAYGLFWTTTSVLVRTVTRSDKAPIPFFITMNVLLFVLVAYHLPISGMTWRAAALSTTMLGLGLGLNHWAASDAPRVTVLGADGVDWEVLNRLVAEGRLPNIARAMSEGLARPLETFGTKSPIVWTSTATGVTPEAHGVLGFVWPYLRGTEVFLPHSQVRLSRQGFGSKG